MLQISYLSSATETMSTEQLIALLQQSLANNAGKNVTGMLLYRNATFLQVLEGDDDEVENLYDTIQKDPRHTNVQILQRKHVDRRQYSDWSMGFKYVSDSDLNNIEGLRNFSERDFNADYLSEHREIAGALIDHFGAPYWDPLVRELDEKEQTITNLKKALAHARGRIEVASLVLESVTNAGRGSGLGAGHVELCELALEALRQG